VLAPSYASRAAALVGMTVDGRYRLVDHLASGGMGSVFRAEHVYMRKPLAVKILRPELSTLPDIVERFRREAQIAASLEHQNIVRVTDFGRSADGWLFLVMELLEGESLYDRLRSGVQLPAEETASILVQVCRGLEAAHERGVVHRDLKPENIFLTRPDGTVKILDFGIAKLSDPTSAGDTHSGIVVGTPEYLSPEQASGGAVDARADVYAAGLIGWRMLAGHHPYQADDARALLMMQATQPLPPLVQVRPDLTATPGLLDAIERACAKDPAARHASAAELRGELEACFPALAVRPVEPRATTASSISSFTPRRPSEAISVTIAVTAAVSPVRPSRVRALVRRSWPLIVLLALGGAAAALSGPARTRVARWHEERSEAEARALLANGRFEAARDRLATILARRPSDAGLRLLQARALHRIDGSSAAALESYAAVLELDPRALDASALSDVAAGLETPALADAAARLLVRAGEPAVPALAGVARTGSAPARLRALELVKQLGAADRVDRVAAYGALLADPDCAVRRAAVRGLAEVGTPEAALRLRELARQTREVRGVFGFPQRAPVCGAVEADAASRAIQDEPR
jgi:serine/threonine-protein kinase